VEDRRSLSAAVQKSLDILSIPTAGALDATIRPPGSKSITNRALICAALADGKSVLSGVLDSEDTRVMIDALRALGVAVDGDAAAGILTVTGCGGQIPLSNANLYVANSGTTIRFLTAMLAACDGEYLLDGTPRMRERPIGDLAAALNQLGAEIKTHGGGCPPVLVVSSGLAGGAVTIRGDISSQYLSGLLMAAPYARSPVHVQIEGTLVSQPYVHMTLAVMRSFGVSVAAPSLDNISIPTGQYHGCDYAIEPDASAASYFWAAPAIAGGRVTVEGLSRSSLQGDVAFTEVLAKMGCRVDYSSDSITVHAAERLRGVDVDMNAISDTVQTLAAVALFADGPTTITGVAHNRHKETDRIADLATELRKVGATVDELPDGLKITPPVSLPTGGVIFDTYNDHRMAMSLSLIGLRVPGVQVRDPGCTAKTYPNFFVDLARVTQRRA
jgi:3-phosphoshikimate 1-carboxyvinyltransferase